MNRILLFIAVICLSSTISRKPQSVVAYAFNRVPISTRVQTSQKRQKVIKSSIPSHVQYDARLSDETFAELYHEHLPAWLLEKCADCGWTTPTLIQKRALDTIFLSSSDNDSTDDEDKTNDQNSIVIQAQTGSGKTLTYLLPLFAMLEDRAAIQAMIVVPTRELGLQVATIAKRLASRKFMVMSILQGSQHKRQRAWAWAETPQVVIGTPSELLNMVQYGGLPRINSVRYVVVDEVDACLVHNSGSNLGGGVKTDATKAFASSSSSLHELLSKYLSPTYMEDENMDMDGTPQRRKFRHRQTVFCSATIPQHRHFLKQCRANQWTLEEPTFICTSPGEALPPTLKHAYMVCNTKDKKLATLRRIVLKLKNNNKNEYDGEKDDDVKVTKVLVFCESSRPMEEMAQALAYDIGGIYFTEGTKKKLQEEVEAKLTTSSSESHTVAVVSVLRFEDSLSQRAAATEAFASSDNSNNSNYRLLLTTDLGARGLDITGITHVVHFDLPPDSDTYLHRSGRAGRLGKSGQVVSILTSDQEFVLERLANVLTLDLKCIGRQKR